MKKKVLLLLLITSTSLYSNDELKIFKTDLCTMFPEGTIRKPGLWKDCCIYHDLKYWIGGTKSEQYKSDITLRECVRENSNWFYASLMFRGIRIGHYSPVKSKYQWGWGWSSDGWFGVLTKEQKLKAKRIIINSNVDQNLKNRFIKEHLNN